jgi:hypothetical protein
MNDSNMSSLTKEEVQLKKGCKNLSILKSLLHSS